MRRAILLFVVTASLVVPQTLASAKGNFPTRSYAVITGPGLSHPIVFVAPWKESRGGFYTSEGERFLALAGGTGALPAGREKTETGGYVPAGVLPIDKVPWPAARGPRYRVTWFRDGVQAVAKQDIYPYGVGGPFVYTLPSSRRALIVLFGRFQSPAHLWTGWGQATSFDLLQFLEFYGLPTRPLGLQMNSPAPATPTRTSDGVTPTGAIVPMAREGRGLAVALSVVSMLVVLTTALHWASRRRVKFTAPSYPLDDT